MIANRDELLALAEFARSMASDKRCERIAVILESFVGPAPTIADANPLPRSCIVDGEVGVIETTGNHA